MTVMFCAGNGFDSGGYMTVVFCTGTGSDSDGYMTVVLCLSLIHISEPTRRA